MLTAIFAVFSAT